MTTLADDRPLTLVDEAVEAISSRLGEPGWATDFRRAGLAAWNELPYPARTDEEWRRTDPERFRPEGRRLVSCAPTFGHLGEEAGGGLTALPLAEALRTRQEEVLLGLFTGVTPHTDKFTALNAAFRDGGAWVSIPAGQRAQAPLTVHHRLGDAQGPELFLPHTVLVAGRDSAATVVETFESGSGDLVAAPVIEVHVGEGAQLQYVLIGRWGDAARAVTRFKVRLEKGASFRVLVVGVGGAVTKTFMSGDLTGEGARSEMLGLLFASARQHFDADTLHNHLVASTGSDVLFNVALNDRSRSVFAGNIYVAPGAQKTDAYQKNRNLLLSDKARADSMPKLEIVANDVRCTHGATFTTYDTDQRFYLQSRGINDADARRLIITGFFQEVIERLEGEALVEWLSELMQARMEATLARA